MRTGGIRFRVLSLGALICLAFSATGCGALMRPELIYPPESAAPPVDCGLQAVLSELEPGHPLLVKVNDSSRFECEYDGWDGDRIRFRQIDRHPMWRDFLFRRLPTETFAVEEITEIRDFKPSTLEATLYMTAFVGMLVAYGWAQSLTD